VTAQRIHLIQAKATRTHKREVTDCGGTEESTDTGTATSTTTSTATSTDDSTTDPSATSTDTSLGGEEDCIVLKRQKKNGGDELETRAEQKSAKIAERLNKTIERLEAKGQTGRIEAVLQKAEAQEEKTAQRVQAAVDRKAEQEARKAGDTGKPDDKDTGKPDKDTGGGQGSGGGGGKGGSKK
jgi:thioredoxin-like negative regulator of GroEL